MDRSSSRISSQSSQKKDNIALRVNKLTKPLQAMHRPK